MGVERKQAKFTFPEDGSDVGKRGCWVFVSVANKNIMIRHFPKPSSQEEIKNILAALYRAWKANLGVMDVFNFVDKESK